MCPTCLLALRAAFTIAFTVFSFVPDLPRAWHSWSASCSSWSRVLRAIVVPYVTFVPRALHVPCAIVIINTLVFPCLKVLFFYSFSTCEYFLRNCYCWNKYRMYIYICLKNFQKNYPDTNPDSKCFMIYLTKFLTEVIAS